MDGQVISANDARSGRVVYLSDGRAWRGEIARARVFRDPAALGQGLRAAEGDEARVVAVRPVAVNCPPGAAPVPCHLRDRLRLCGPGHLTRTG